MPSLLSSYQVGARQAIELLHVSFANPEFHVEMIVVGHNVIVLQHFLNDLSVLGRKLNLIAEPVEESDTSSVVSERRFLF